MKKNLLKEKPIMKWIFS